MPWEQSFIVEGKFLGTALRTHTSWTKDASPPDGYNFCCPTCGNLWAVCPVVGRPFHFLTRGCPSHERIAGDGSLWTGWDADFTGSFPQDLLRRELDWHLQHMEAFE